MQGRILITRPEQDAAPLKAALEEAGRKVIVAPLFEIKQQAEINFDFKGVAYIALTSANGARALAAASKARDIGVFAVGEATADMARCEGFKIAAIADGNAASLTEVIVGHYQSNKIKGDVLHIGGKHQAGNLVDALINKGIPARRAVLYEAVKINAFAPEIISAFQDVTIEWVTFYSPRTAKVFMDLARAHDILPCLKSCKAALLSDAVLEALYLPDWGEVYVAQSSLSQRIIDILLSEPPYAKR